MSLLTSMVVGGLIGWLARMLAPGQPRLNMFVSIVVGAVGALVSGWLFAPMMGLNPALQDSFSIVAVGLAVAGAVTLLGIVDFARQLASR